MEGDEGGLDSGEGAGAGRVGLSSGVHWGMRRSSDGGLAGRYVGGEVEGPALLARLRLRESVDVGVGTSCLGAPGFVGDAGAAVGSLGAREALTMMVGEVRLCAAEGGDWAFVSGFGRVFLRRCDGGMLGGGRMDLGA